MSVIHLLEGTLQVLFQPDCQQYERVYLCIFLYAMARAGIDDLHFVHAWSLV